MTVQAKLGSIKAALKSGNRCTAAAIADGMIICSAAEQGGGYSGMKVLEHRGQARLVRVESFLLEPEFSSLQFFESIEDAQQCTVANPIRFTPYAGDALSGGSN